MGIISLFTCGIEAESIRSEIVARGHLSEAVLANRFAQAQAQAQGDFPDTIKPDALAGYLTTLLHGMAVRLAAGTPRATLERLIEATLATWPSR